MKLKSLSNKRTFFFRRRYGYISWEQRCFFDAVSSITSAIDLVENKKLKNAFCAVRPPGHHAEYDKAMGFCIFNNIAVGANYLLEKYISIRELL